MKSFNRPLSQFIAISLAAMLGIVPLVGCNKGEQAPADATATEQTTEPAAQADPTEQPIWVISKQTSTYTSGEDSSTVTITYERDEQGNYTTMTTDAGEAGITVETRELDADGFATAVHTKLGEEVNDVTYQLTKDDQGRLTKREGSDGSIMEYTYDAEGHVTNITFSLPAIHTDENGNKDEFNYQLQQEYDTSGLLLKSSVQSVGNNQVTEKTYERDDQGRPVTATTRMWTVDENDEPQGDFVDETSVSVEYDDNGNVARVTQKGEAFTNVIEYEYVQVAQPSLGAQLEAYFSIL